ncbi:MAG: ornithine carbamoyltransferase [Burkholderiales bacterium]
MVLNLKHRSVNDFASMSPQDTAALLAHARELQQALRAGTPHRGLRGKNLGLMCDTTDDGGAALFQRAASALGAQVAHLRPSLSERSSPDEVSHTARVLGRLYDAVDCIGMAPGLVRSIGTHAGVPVFESIASPRHPIAKLAEQLDGDTAGDDNRCLVIQAVLLNALN